MKRVVGDIETDGIKATKIHCFCYYDIDTKESVSLISYEDIVEFFKTPDLTIIWHNGIRYDKVQLQNVLGIKIEARMIDTLALSWVIYPLMKKHGLEEWGEIFGVPKPKIIDWVNLPIEEYVHRCEEDVKINTKLWFLLLEYLFKLYQTKEGVDRFIKYLMFKMDCAAEQEEIKWRLDVDKAKKHHEFFVAEFERRVEQVADLMPKKITYKIVSRPTTLYKKDGEVSVAGQKWLDLLKEHNLPDYHMSPIKVVTKIERGNPNSTDQLKDWLFGLGWVPQTFEVRKSKVTGVIKRIPQINTKDDGICESIKDLYEDHPELEALEGMGIVAHRLGIIKGYLENVDEEGFVKAEIQGFTNTLRFKHTTVVNLPQLPKPYWKEVRECLIAPDDNHVLCGSDMSSLEDSTKRHYMFFYDPEYVKEMMVPGFDPHLDVAVVANLLTPEQVEEHKLYDRTKGAEGVSHKATRGVAKKGNFTAVYGAGGPKIAEAMKQPVEMGYKFHKGYWKRNWSVKRIARDCIVKTIGEQMWLFNPVSKFWYSLRHDKDRFSTLNQGTGVYCFDINIMFIRKQGIRICGQFHDESIQPILKGTEEAHSAKLNKAIQQANDLLNLNVKLGISIDYGHSYADIH